MDNFKKLDLHDLESVAGGRTLTVEESHHYEELVNEWDKAFHDMKAGKTDRATVDAAYARVVQYAKTILAEPEK